MAMVGPAHRASKPGGTAWQLKVFVAHQANSQLFVDGLAHDDRWRPRDHVNAYRPAPTSSYAGLNETSSLARPGQPTLRRVRIRAAHPRSATPSRPAGVPPGAQPTNVQLRWVPPDNQTQSIDAAVTAARAAHNVIIFAYDEGTEGRDRGISDQAACLALPLTRTR